MRNSYVQIILAALFFAETVFGQVGGAALMVERLAPQAAKVNPLGKKTPIAEGVEEMIHSSARASSAASKAGSTITINGVTHELPNGARVAFSGARPNTPKNAISMLKNTGKFMGGTFLHFLPEAAAFFMALGALSYGQLVLDFAENPISMEQHLQAHDPRTPEGRIGFISFYFFMLGNRMCNNLLNPMVGPRSKMRAFIPYLGMTCGFTASNIVHEIASFSDLKKCVASLKLRVDNEQKYASCEKAYDSWTEAFTEKAQQYTPTLVAMMTSVLTAGVATMPLRHAMKAAGLEVIVTGGPGSLKVKAARVVWKIGVDLMLFTAIQHWQEPTLTRWFQNMSDGSELKSSQHAILYGLDQKKRNGWRPTKNVEEGYDLDLTIRKFTERAKEWRKGNIVDILNAHSAWQQFLLKLSTGYKAASEFEALYMEEYHKKFTKKQDSLLDVPFYLAGVNPRKPEAQAAEEMDEQAKLEAEMAQEDTTKQITALNQLANKRDYEYRQVEHLIEVRDHYENWIESEPEATRKQYAKFYAEISEVLQYLPTQTDWDSKKLDYPKIAKGLDLLNSKLKIENKNPELNIPIMPVAGNVDKNDPRPVLVQLRYEIGDPWPLYQPGAGFLKAYSQDADKKEALFTLEFPKEWNGLKLLGPTHYLASQILGGPRADLKQPLIKESLGFPADFVPPRLVHSFTYKVSEDTKKETSGQPTIMNTAISVVSPGGQTEFKNAFGVLRSQNVLPSILNEKDGFSGWWNKNVESQYIQAWTKYENEYQKLMVKLLERYRYDEKEARSWQNWWEHFSRSGMNVGPMANGLRQAFLQERRLYLMVLGEAIRSQKELIPSDSGLLKSGSKVASVNAQNYPLLMQTAGDLVRKAKTPCDKLPATKQDDCREYANSRMQNIPILEILRDNQTLNLSRIMADYKNPSVKPYETEGTDTHLDIQDQVIKDFEELDALFDKMKITSVIGREITIPLIDKTLKFDSAKKIVVTDVTNKQFTAARDKIQETVGQIELALEQRNIDTQNPHVFQIARAALAGLRSLAQQQSDLGKIINAVSYTRMTDDTDKSGRNSLCEEMSLTALRKNRFGQTFERKGCDAGTRIEQSKSESKLTASEQQ